jgi:hypothetical protein
MVVCKKLDEMIQLRGYLRLSLARRLDKLKQLHVHKVPSLLYISTRTAAAVPISRRDATLTPTGRGENRVPFLGTVCNSTRT